MKIPPSPYLNIIINLKSFLQKFYTSISNPDEVGASLIDTLYNNQKKVNSPANIKPDNLYDLKILYNRREYHYIIITEANKSNFLVVMNMTNYDKKIYSHLNDKTTYTAIAPYHTDQFAKKIINELKNLKQNRKITPQ